MSGEYSQGSGNAIVSRKCGTAILWAARHVRESRKASYGSMNAKIMLRTSSLSAKSPTTMVVSICKIYVNNLGYWTSVYLSAFNVPATVYSRRTVASQEQVSCVGSLRETTQQHEAQFRTLLAGHALPVVRMCTYANTANSDRHSHHRKRDDYTLRESTCVGRLNRGSEGIICCDVDCGLTAVSNGDVLGSHDRDWALKVPAKRLLPSFFFF